MIYEEVLLNAGADFRPQGDELLVQCPFCDARFGTPDSKRRLGINVVKHKAHCVRCEWMASGLRQIVKALCREYGLPYDIMGLIRMEREIGKREIEVKEPVPQVTGLPAEFERFTGGSDFVEKAARAYLKKRGVTLEQIKKHGIGFAAVGEMAWRVIFPVFGRNKKVYGYVGRDITDTQKPKYLNSRGPKLLWGAHVQAEAAVVSEGIMDALRVEHILTDAAAIADLGSAITPYQIAQLKRYKTVIYLPHWDPAGIKAALRIGQKCMAAGLKIHTAVPDVLDGSDPGSMDLEFLRKWASTARPYSESLTFRLRGVRIG